MGTGLNKWAKKLDKEYQKASYTLEEREYHEWYGDVETDTSYTWKFDCPIKKTHNVWTLNKETGAINKR